MPEMDFDVEFGDPKKRVRITDLDAPNPSVSDLHGHIERLQGEFPGYEFRRQVSSCVGKGSWSTKSDPLDTEETLAVSHALADF